MQTLCKNATEMGEKIKFEKVLGVIIISFGGTWWPPINSPIFSPIYIYSPILRQQAFGFPNEWTKPQLIIHSPVNFTGSCLQRIMIDTRIWCSW